MNWAKRLGLPPAALAGDKGIPKTVLTKQGGLTKTEGKLLKQYVRLEHVATIQRTTARIAPISDENHEIASVIYLRCVLVRAGGLAELAGVLHKVFPNPVVLLFEEPGGKVGVSVSLKRRSLSEKGAVVVERIESARLFDPDNEAYADYLDDIRHTALPQSNLLAYVMALCDRTVKAEAIVAIGEYPNCKDADTPELMKLLEKLREVESAISVLRMRYCDKEASIAQTSKIRMELAKIKKEHARLIARIVGLCSD